MAVEHRASATGSADPTTTFTITIPASVQADDVLFVFVTSRNHTSGDAYPTVTDDDTGGNTWSRINGTDPTDRKATLWYKRATSGSASKTVTVDGCIQSSSGGISAYSGALTTDPPYADIAVQDNASGTETHTGFTPTAADSMVGFAVYNTGNDQLVTAVACTDPATMLSRFEQQSTGGSDCSCTHWSALQSGGPSATGDFTWSQPNNTTKSLVFTIQPALAATGNVNLFDGKFYGKTSGKLAS